MGRYFGRVSGLRVSDSRSVFSFEHDDGSVSTNISSESPLKKYTKNVKYNTEADFNKTYKIRKKLKEKFPGVKSGRDTDDNNIILVPLGTFMVRAEAKADRVFFFPVAEVRELLFDTLCMEYGKKNVSVVGDNNLIQLLIEV